MGFKVIGGKLVKTKGGKIVQVRKIRSYVDMSRSHGANRDRIVSQNHDHLRMEPVDESKKPRPVETRVAPVQPRRENGCVYPVDPKDFPKDKGVWNGACNRSACLAYPALWYNRGSYAFYCEECAHMLNEVNRNDEFCRTGGPLCREIETEVEANTLHCSPHR